MEPQPYRMSVFCRGYGRMSHAPELIMFQYPFARNTFRSEVLGLVSAFGTVLYNSSKELVVDFVSKEAAIMVKDAISKMLLSEQNRIVEIFNSLIGEPIQCGENRFGINRELTIRGIDYPPKLSNGLFVGTMIRVIFDLKTTRKESTCEPKSKRVIFSIETMPETERELAEMIADIYEM
jgi:hypothetical protein